ncbi:TOPRS ligase, partial [Glaucidium brasilianum]|nr:TOPRS ligase [Glaucidium brasilianum]
MESEEICPICRDCQDDAVYVLPCYHQFCLGCILQWMDVKAECPLCRGPVETVQFAMQGGNGYRECAIMLLEGSPEASSQADTAASLPDENRPHGAAASPPSSPQGTLYPHEQGAAEPEAVGGIMPEVWASFFQTNECIVSPVEIWLHWELVGIYGSQWWQVRRAEGNVLCVLCAHGPVAEVMVRELQPILGEHTAPLVRGIIDAIERCSDDVWRRSPAVGEEDDSSEARGSPTNSGCSGSRCGTPNIYAPTYRSPERSDREEEAGTSEAALRGGPGHPPSAPVPAEQEQAQGEPGEAVAAGPSAPRQRRNRSSGRPRRPPKRRVPGPQDSPQPCKRPPRRQH